MATTLRSQMEKNQGKESADGPRGQRGKDCDGWIASFRRARREHVDGDEERRGLAGACWRESFERRGVPWEVGLHAGGHVEIVLDFVTAEIAFAGVLRRERD